MLAFLEEWERAEGTDSSSEAREVAHDEGDEVGDEAGVEMGVVNDEKEDASDDRGLSDCRSKSES